MDMVWGNGQAGAGDSIREKAQADPASAPADLHLADLAPLWGDPVLRCLASGCMFQMLLRCRPDAVQMLLLLNPRFCQRPQLSACQSAGIAAKRAKDALSQAPRRADACWLARLRRLSQPN
ncbi:hypothetical protein E4U24_004980 [Claviceps purpurea]|nr:hypothetical protein E4U24_004980 [Claviceps purpurea]